VPGAVSQASPPDAEPGPSPHGSAPALTLDPARQTKARAFASQRRGLSYLETILLALYLVVWILGGLSSLIAVPLRSLGVPWWAGVLVQGIAFFLPRFVISLPFRYLGSYALPRQFGLLTQSLRSWAVDFAKEVGLLAALGLPSILGLYALLRYAADSWWLWAAVGFTLSLLLIAAILPVILLPIFYRVRPLAAQHAELAERLSGLAQRARARVRGVFSLEFSRRTPAANALLLGLGKFRRILLADTLLANFTHDEIETVVAHELAHHIYHDIPVGIGVHALLSLAAFKIADIAYRAYAATPRLKSLDDPAALPILMMTLALSFFLTSPFSKLYSRWRESRADAFALRLTRKPQAFASAMRRFANLNLAVANPSRLASEMASHPSLVSRIRKAEAFAAELGAGDDHEGSSPTGHSVERL